MQDAPRSQIRLVVGNEGIPQPSWQRFCKFREMSRHRYTESENQEGRRDVNQERRFEDRAELP